MQPISSSRKSPVPKILTHGPLRVVFTWQLDRWEHVIEPIGDAERIGDIAGREHDRSEPAAMAWRSVSALPVADPRWPASPVLVELTAVPAPRGTSLVGLGLAGRSHFSASLGPDPEDARSLRFDLACRTAEPGWLGTTYAACGTAKPEGHEPASGIVLEPLPGSILEPPGTCRVSAGNGPLPPAMPLIRILPANPPDRFPATVRWSYRVRLGPPVSRPIAD